MPTERIIADGLEVTTLRELIRPDLRAVIVGINPAVTSVAAGHYWQGQHGLLMWRWLERFDILHGLRKGYQDEDAYAQGVGFADLIRIPSGSASALGKSQKLEALPSLLSRLQTAPLAAIIFRYKSVYDLLEGLLRAAGRRVYRLPPPPGRYSGGPPVAERLMLELVEGIGRTGRIGPQ